MGYTSDRCVLDQLTAGAREEEWQGMGAASEKIISSKKEELKHRWKTEKKKLGHTSVGFGRYHRQSRSIWQTFCNCFQERKKT